MPSRPSRRDVKRKAGEKIECYKAGGAIGSGDGEKAGVAYRMEDGSIVYAPEAREVSLQRRVLLGCGLGTVGALAGCAVSAPASPDRITAPASGEPMARTALLDLMRNGDYVLLGEHHDNTDHHRLRAELLAALPAPVAVVVEHLPRGAAPLLSRNQRGSALLLALQEAGFDARGWRWPLHEPLFTAIAAGGHRLLGGNLPRELARRTAREGAEALPAELRAAIDAAPLAAGARATLVDDLVSGHCGNLPPERTPSMVLAQRGRDAAMALSMIGARSGRPSGCVLLLAGNGHVRRDYGVAQLLQGLQPGARVLSVGFVEPGGSTSPGAFDLTWTTPAVDRVDPCKAPPIA
jgi:uncharacterized iron-regulated protein